MTSPNPTEAVSSEVVVSDASGLEITNTEATPAMPTVSRSPRLKQSTTEEKPSSTKERQLAMKEKKNKPVSVTMSPRNSLEVRQKEKKDK